MSFLHIIKGKLWCFPLIGISLCCGSLRPWDWLAAWLVREDYYIVRKYPVVIFPRLGSDNIVCLELHATGIVGLRRWWCGGWLRDRDLWSWGVWGETGRGGGGREGRGISGEFCIPDVCLCLKSNDGWGPFPLGPQQGRWTSPSTDARPSKTPVEPTYCYQSTQCVEHVPIPCPHSLFSADLMGMGRYCGIAMTFPTTCGWMILH